MSKTIRPLFSWRHAICKSELNSSTKLVLFALSFYMNEMGSSCFPTQTQLASDTGLSDRQVRRALVDACKFGWLKRQLHGFRGQRWKNYEYHAAVPIGMSRHKGADTLSGDAKKDRTNTTEGPDKSSKKDRTVCPTNTPYNSSLTLQQIEEEKTEKLAGHLQRLRAARRP